MELIGKIIQTLEERGGISARTGAEWRLASYVLETVSDRYPRKMVFEVFGTDKIQQFNIQVLIQHLSVLLLHLQLQCLPHLQFRLSQLLSLLQPMTIYLSNLFLFISLYI